MPIIHTWQPTSLLRTAIGLLILLFTLPMVTEAAGLKTNSATRAILQANDELPPTIWRQILATHAVDGSETGYFLVFKLHGTYFSYDIKNGSRRIWPVDATARELAHAITPLAVEGDFVSPESFAR